MNMAGRIVVFWGSMLIVAVVVYSTAPSLHALAHPAPPYKQIEYSITPVLPSTDVRAMLEIRGNEGWDLAAPVVSNGATTALIFKRERK